MVEDMTAPFNGFDNISTITSNYGINDVPIDKYDSNKSLEDIVNVYKYTIKTYGCQMNASDTSLIRSLLLNPPSNDGEVDYNDNNGYYGYNEDEGRIRFEEIDNEGEADIVLTNTCAIREGAEDKGE